MKNKVICSICDKEFSKYGIKNHINQAHNGKKNPMSGKNAWNKGLSKETDERILKHSNQLKETFKDGSPFTGKNIQ